MVCVQRFGIELLQESKSKTYMRVYNLQDTEPLGVIPTLGYKVTKVDIKKPFSFCLEHPGIKFINTF